MTSSDQVNDLATALVAAQAKFAVPKKSHTAKVPTKAGGQYSYAYSTLDELIEATRPALTANGLAVVQNVSSLPGAIAVSTRIVHVSGQWIDFDPVTLPAGDSPQSVGAAITYGRRYSQSLALNVAAEEDDDGGTAVVTKPEPAPPQGVHGPLRPAPAEQPRPLTPPEQRAVDAGKGDVLLISDKQAKRFYAIAKNAGWADGDLNLWLRERWGYNKNTEIPRSRYDEICKAVAEGPQ